MDRICSTHGEKRNVCKVSVRKAEGQRSLARPRLRQQNVLNWILEKYHGELWIRFISLRVGMIGGFLSARQ
jgi:hypothetical protein